jgi:hypothetical protein
MLRGIVLRIPLNIAIAPKRRRTVVDHKTSSAAAAADKNALLSLRKQWKA